MRGSDIRLVSSFAGAARSLVGKEVGDWALHTSCDNPAVIGGEIVLATAAWGEECGVGCAPEVIGGV
jgi:hypothetical protein